MYLPCIPTISIGELWICRAFLLLAIPNLQAVLITASPYRGSSINDLSVWDEFRKAWPDARLADVS
jgi:hypothetical protein